MTKVKEKLSFSKIWKLLCQFDAAQGIFLLKDVTEKKTKIEKLLSLTTPIQLFMFTILICSTLFVTKFALINIIFSCALVLITCTFLFILFKMVKQKDVLKELLDWCQDLYNLEIKFSESVRKIAKTRIITCEKRTSKYLKQCRIILYMDIFSATIGTAVIFPLLPESIVTKFTVPVPFYLPFENQQSWLAYISTSLWITKAAVDCATTALYVCGTFLCIFLHIHAYLEIIKDVVVKIKEEMLKNKVDKNKVKLSTKNTSTLTIINGSSSFNKQTRKNIIPFVEWIKIVTEMVCDVNSIISKFSKFYTEFFLLLEIASLSSLFICGLMFIIIRQQYMFAIGITFPIFMLFLVCFFNEKILDALDDLNKSLYDIPWYELTPKQNKMLKIELNCDKIQRGFTAAGIHNLTLERFWIVIKAGYTNVLVLRDMVTK